MDDTFESEIIYDIVTAHVQICKRYAAMTYVSIFNIFVLAPGETLQTKMLKPAPFMMLMLMIILISLVIQSNKSLRTYLCNLHSVLTPSVGLRFSNLTKRPGLASIANCVGGQTQVIQEVREGLVGIYAMQGRRGNMEDRFCVLQDVSVGLDKRMSFFGVYDGHGGQYVAEYLRTHLFANTVEKIKQLLASIHDNEKQNTAATNLMPKSTQKRPSMSNVLDTETAKDASSQVKRSDSSKSTKSNKDFVGEKVAKDKANECIKSCIGDDEPSTEQDCVTNESFSKSIAGDKLLSSTAKRSDSEENVNETPLKKDDAYNTLNIRKKSLANIKESAKEVGSVSSDDNHLYVDLNKNINYTKLLTDQILYLDSQVVEHCKTNTDLSGSTAVVAVLDGELLVVGNVGDSRAVMADDRGRAIPLSFDHKPNQLKERRRIKEAGGFITFTGVWRVAGILATSRALGDFPLKHPRPLVTAEPDILTFSLNDHKAQFVILATDGLWDVLSNEDAVSYVRARLHEPDFGAKSVAQYAYALGSQDNITVAIINFTKMNKNNTTPR